MTIIIHRLNKPLLILRDRIISFYHQSELYRMPPHFRHFHVSGFGDGKVMPTVGVRRVPILEKLPYSSGDQIELDMEIEITKKSPQIAELPYSWRLVELESKDIVKNDSGVFRISPFDKNKLVSYLSFWQTGKGKEYILEIQIIQGSLILFGWKEIFSCELHSSDKLLHSIIFPIIVSVVTALLTTIISYVLLQRIL